MSATPQHDPPTPSFQFSIWDLMVRMSTLCCFVAAVRYAGALAFILFPAVLIGPSVLTHAANSPEAKFLFILINLGIAALLLLSPRLDSP